MVYKTILDCTNHEDYRNMALNMNFILPTFCENETMKLSILSGWAIIIFQFQTEWPNSIFLTTYVGFYRGEQIINALLLLQSIIVNLSTFLIQKQNWHLYFHPVGFSNRKPDWVIALNRFVKLILSKTGITHRGDEGIVPL